MCPSSTLTRARSALSTHQTYIFYCVWFLFFSDARPTGRPWSFRSNNLVTQKWKEKVMKKTALLKPGHVETDGWKCGLIFAFNWFLQTFKDIYLSKACSTFRMHPVFKMFTIPLQKDEIVETVCVDYSWILYDKNFIWNVYLCCDEKCFYSTF